MLSERLSMKHTVNSMLDVMYAVQSAERCAAASTSAGASPAVTMSNHFRSHLLTIHVRPVIVIDTVLGSYHFIRANTYR
jgi:hypothetical protein